MMRKVLFATPSYDGRIHVDYMYSLLETIKLAAENNIALYPVVISHDALVQRVRNDFAKMALETDCDDLVFMDCDQEWDPIWVLRLLSHDVDVVGCPVPKKSDINIDFNIIKIKGEQINDQGLLIVKSIGTGFLRISKNALEQIWNTSPSYIEKEKETRMIFDVQVIDNELYSEDTVFCKKWRDIGGTVYADTTMTCNHIGNKKYGGNFAEFYKSLLLSDQSST